MCFQCWMCSIIKQVTRVTFDDVGSSHVCSHLGLVDLESVLCLVGIEKTDGCLVCFLCRQITRVGNPVAGHLGQRERVPGCVSVCVCLAETGSPPESAKVRGSPHLSL